MSKDIVVLAPNGHRQTVKCTLNTTILQILEDVCKKQGFQAGDYDLTHHNKIMDLSNTIRFTNLPNKALLEMVEAERKREDNIVTIGLQLENGERKLGDFSPNSSLYIILESLAKEEMSGCQHPTIVYTRREVFGEDNLRNTTLRHLGLTGGRAILRLIDKSPESLKSQANVSSVLPARAPQASYSASTSGYSRQPGTSEPTQPTPSPGTSSKSNDKPTAHGINPIQFLRDEKNMKAAEVDHREIPAETAEPVDKVESENVAMACEDPAPTTSHTMESESSMEVDEDLLERRLNIENEVTFLGESHKAIAFIQPDNAQDELEELPDEFYELSIEEVRRLYKDMQRQRHRVENAPLVTAKYRTVDLNAQRSQSCSVRYAVVRIQFPDRMVLQGIFEPTDTLGTVTNFTRSYLKEPNRPFHLFTTPLREILEPTVTLQEAKYVPCVLMHFRWAEERPGEDGSCLTEQVYASKTSSDAAAMLASKYRRKLDSTTAGSSKEAGAISPEDCKDSKVPKRSTSETGRQAGASDASGKNTKVPKWFKKP